MDVLYCEESTMWLMVVFLGNLTSSILTVPIFLGKMEIRLFALEYFFLKAQMTRCSPGLYHELFDWLFTGHFFLIVLWCCTPQLLYETWIVRLITYIHRVLAFNQHGIRGAQHRNTIQIKPIINCTAGLSVQDLLCLLLCWYVGGENL